MPFRATQQSFVDRPARLFLMDASMFGVPLQAFHRFVGDASMRVRVAGFYPMVDAHGDAVLDRSETVTLFNDMCILAPGTLVDDAIVWTPIDDHSAKAHFTLGTHSITATLFFNEQGLLRDFVSEDRSRSLENGRKFAADHFSTPVRDYRRFGPYRLASFGEARSRAPEGDFTYGEFSILDVAYNVP
jgi:hypothetical protein